MEILDQYTASAPSIQNTIDIFKGEWSSKLPADLGELQAGEAGLFEDGRIYWAAEQLGGFQGKTVLELGPLEAGHTYVMEQLGASSITAVEANSRAYLKCLLVKEILGMDRSHFVYGDCIEFLQANQQPFEICVASGILYHMRNPAQLIALLAKTCNQLFVWTHYYDSEVITNNSDLQPRFSQDEHLDCEGFHHQLYRQEYQTALGWGGFCGGSATYSRWMNRDDILACCRHFGFQDIRISFDHPNHPNGPCFAFVASKKGTVPVKKPDDTLEQNLSASIQADYHQKIHQLQQEIRHLKAKSERLEQKFETAQARITAMETSKFWQLRKSWFQFKKIFHLPSNE